MGCVMRDGIKTKESIERTSLRLFVEKGIAETTIRDIASAAGIAEGTMYRHYAGKEELARSLFSKNFAGFSRELDRFQKGQSGTRKKIEAMVRRFCAFFDEDPILFSYLFLHARHTRVSFVEPDAPHALNILVKVIADGMERGEIPERNPHLVASMVAGVVLQVATARAYGEIDESLMELSDVLVVTAWKVVKG